MMLSELSADLGALAVTFDVHSLSAMGLASGIHPLPLASLSSFGIRLASGTQFSSSKVDNPFRLVC